MFYLAIIPIDFILRVVGSQSCIGVKNMHASWLSAGLRLYQFCYSYVLSNEFPLHLL